MQISKYPLAADWDQLLQRPTTGFSDISDTVATIIGAVKKRGDAALAEYTERFDGYAGTAWEIPPIQWASGEALISPELKKSIDLAIQNILYFHNTQLEVVRYIDTMPGITCYRKGVAIEKVGLYIPGGTAPLFSTLLMLAIPAIIAGCKEVVVCTPADANGEVHPAILYAAAQTGIHRLFRLGGAQAIAAMAFGTETVPQVYKLFGPGNRYVTCAKMLVAAEGIAIDMPAGPSEVAVLADAAANPAFVAADLLSQAEHGTDSQVILVSDSASLITAVNEAVAAQLEDLPRKEIAAKALANSKAILVNNLEEGMQLLNSYGPEHLIIACAAEARLAELVVNAGSVFLGQYSPESVGDYASGTNHTLPTSGFAKAYSGVSVDSFLKKITFQRLTKEGLHNIGDAVINMATAEGLAAHANAVRIRTKQ
jgi:histidinol dehydrogenase